ncbi:phosphatases II, partial [Rozella allomycis CSF55]
RFYAFQNKIESNLEWIDYYDPFKEFERMGGNKDPKRWRLSTANENYSICKTYPKVFGVPEKISDNVIFHAAKFRTKNRLPVLSFIYSPNFGTITRSSQPLVGIKQNRSIQDEKLLEAIFDSNSDLKDQSMKNYIIDARPTTNAMGAGFESTQNYKNSKRMFMGIENIHVMRESLNKLIEDMGYENWLSALEATDWMKHIKLILDAVIIIVKGIYLEGANVLIHCRWDRTAQLSGLAQLCLDPYFRTIQGYIVLIEKEWISFGHKFLDRCGHLSKHPKSHHYKECSPVFHQFLECTWQIMQQNPTHFEFNERFLVDVFEGLYSCQFGNFLLNCEHDRYSRGIYKNTVSIWQIMTNNKDKYINKDYLPLEDVMLPLAAPFHLRFWHGLYCRFS